MTWNKPCKQCISTKLKPVHKPESTNQHTYSAFSSPPRCCTQISPARMLWIPVVPRKGLSALLPACHEMSMSVFRLPPGLPHVGIGTGGAVNKPVTHAAPSSARTNSPRTAPLSARNSTPPAHPSRSSPRAPPGPKTAHVPPSTPQIPPVLQAKLQLNLGKINAPDQLPPPAVGTGNFVKPLLAEVCSVRLGQPTALQTLSPGLPLTTRHHWAWGGGGSHRPPTPP